MAVIRILIADDHALLRDSLIAFIDLFPDLQVVGTSVDGLNTLAKLHQHKPDVLLLDLAMPNLSGLEVLRRIQEDHIACKVLVMSQHETPEYVLPALEYGAHGYILKRASGKEVVAAVRSIHRGERYLHPAIAGFVIEAALQKDDPDRPAAVGPLLTTREEEVLALIADGMTNQEIARALSLSPKTIDKYRGRLTKKLGLSSRAALIRYGLSRKLPQT